VDRSGGDKLLLSFLLADDSENYLKKMLDLMQKLNAGSSGFQIEHCTILICESFEPLQKELLSLVRDLSQRSDHQGILLAGRAELNWFSPTKLVSDHPRWPLTELSLMEESRQERGVEAEKKSRFSLRKLLLRIAFVILMSGLLIESIWYLAPKALAWVQNSEVDELVERMQELPSEGLYLRLKGLRVARYNENLESALDLYCIRAWKQYSWAGRSRDDVMAGEVNDLITLYPDSPALKFYKTLLQMDKEFPNQEEVVKKIWDELGQKQGVRLLALTDRLLHLDSKNDPYGLLFFYPEVMAKESDSEILPLLQESFANALERTLGSVVTGRENFLLEILAKVPQDIGKSVLEESLQDKNSTRFQSALNLWLNQDNLHGLKLREILGVRLEKAILSAAEIQVLLGIKKTFMGIDFMLDWLQEENARLKRRNAHPDLQIVMEQAFLHLKRLEGN
jgi:hypothetical protein